MLYRSIPASLRATLVGAASALAFLALAPTASAQLDLPKNRKEAPAKKKTPKDLGSGKDTGSITAGKVGTKEKKVPIIGPDGKPVGTKTVTNQNAPGAGTETSSLQPSGRGDSGTLQVPKGDVARPADAPAGPTSANDDVPDPFGEGVSTRTAAKFLYDRSRKLRRASDPEAKEIAERLARLGDDGLTVGRFSLAQDDPVQAYIGAATLLRAGNADDADRVLRLVRGRAPKGSGHLILAELLELDPVRAAVPVLGELLTHKDAQIRRVAERALRERLTVDDLESLEAALGDRSSEVRRAATELLTGLEGREVTERLLERVTDRSTSVASIAIDHVARLDDDNVEFELLQRAFEKEDVQRPAALILLAIVEREDALSKEILIGQHVPPLLRAMNDRSMLVRSTAALALAGIGFRSPDADATPWLDDSVPSALIDVASGSEFFDGFDLLREPAVRRIRQISGVSHGNDGPAWSRWWRAVRDDFRADRAVIPVADGDAARIVVRVEPGGGEAPFVLAGPSLATGASFTEGEALRARARRGVDAVANVHFLEDADAEDLVAFLRESGIFGAERLPGPRGTFGGSGRLVEVEVDGRSKSFRFGVRSTTPWFDRILVRSRGLRDRAAWQRYPIAGTHGARRDLFLAEREWWTGEHTDAERAERMASLVLGHLAAAPPVQRDGAVAELVAMVDDGRAVVTPEDTTALIELLDVETSFGARAQGLTQLIRASVRDADDNVARATNELLLRTLHDRFGSYSLDALVAVLSDSGRDVVLSAVVEENSVMRVAAALALGESGREADADLLAGMLRDHDPEVRVAALQSLGELKAESARSAVQNASLDRNPNVRAAALRATGILGGEGAIDVLVRGLTDPDSRNHLSAAEGLANLEVAETAPLLVSLLRGTRPDAVRNEARRGLLALGPLSHDELFAAMRSPDAELKRDAALLLARQAEPRSVPVLASILASDRDDLEVGHELAVLTCVDYRDEASPSELWFRWWDEVDRRDSFGWFLAALEQRSVRAPDREAFDGEGTEEARIFLLTVIRQFDDPLRERARRILEERLGQPLDPVPTDEYERDDWLVRVRALAMPSEAARPDGDR